MSTKGLGRGLSALIPQQQSESKQADVQEQTVATEPKKADKATAGKKRSSAAIPVRVEKRSQERIQKKSTGVSTKAKQAAAPQQLKGSRSVEQVMELDIERVTPNPMQPRQHFDSKTLDQLAESILQYGLLEPIVVTEHEDGWQIVAGERRYRAHKLLGKKTIKALSRTASELERLELGLIENIQREDLHPIEKAQSYARLVDEFGLTQSEAAKKLGIARSSLANTIRLLDLPVEVQDALAGRKITEGHAKVLLGLETEDEQLAVFRGMVSGGAMSVKQLTEEVEKRSPKKKQQSARSLELEKLQDRLQEILGTAVQVKRNGKEGHKIIIETFSSEELKSVIRKIAS